MPRLPVNELIEQHRTAYALLMHLDKVAEQHPAWLGPETVERLSRGRTCVDWLEERRGELPAHLVPPTPLEHFANLLSSFFDVSFKGASVTAPGPKRETEVYWASVRRKRTPEMRRAADAEVAIAVRYQLSRDGTKLDLDRCRELSARGANREHALIVAYLWELERRAIGKSKGPVAHRIWLNMEYDTRTRLSAEMFEHAMKCLHEAAKEHEGG